MNSLTKILLPICLGLLLCLILNNAWGYTPEECVRCHHLGSTESTLQISIEEFKASAHGEEVTCPECHTRVVDEKHETTKGSGVADCSECHEEENRHGIQSKEKDRPQCYSCHTRHDILGADREDSSIHQGQLTKTCKGCHPVACGKTDALSWLPSLQISSHGKEDFSREYTKGNCLGCHQGMAAHGETYPLNDMDCHLCHAPRNGKGPLLGYIHPKADPREQPSTFAAGLAYALLGVVLLWGGFRYYLRKFSGNHKREGSSRC
jgi:hypothetical protein